MSFATRIVLVSTVALMIGPTVTLGCDDPSDERPAVELVLGRLLPEEGGPADTDPGPLKEPFGVDFTPEATMIIVELGGGRVHSLSPEGVFDTISGDGSTGYQGDGGPARSATFNGIHNVAVTPDGAIYIADSWNHCVRRIDPLDGTISTIAGTGASGDSGDDGPATDATFNYIMCATLSPDSRLLYLADLNNRRIRVFDLASGIVSAVAGDGRKGIPTDGEPATD